MRTTASGAYYLPARVPKMPPGLVELMEDLTRSVIKNNPENVYEFCANHMKILVEKRDGRPISKSLSLEQKIKRAQKKIQENAEIRRQKYDQAILLSTNDSVKQAEGPVSEVIDKTLKPPIHHEHDLARALEVEMYHQTKAESLKQSLPSIETINKCNDGHTSGNDLVVENIQLHNNLRELNELELYTAQGKVFDNVLSETDVEQDSGIENEDVKSIDNVTIESDKFKSSPGILDDFQNEMTHNEISKEDSFQKRGSIDNNNTNASSTSEEEPKADEIDIKSNDPTIELKQFENITTPYHEIVTHDNSNELENKDVDSLMIVENVAINNKPEQIISTPENATNNVENKVEEMKKDLIVEDSSSEEIKIKDTKIDSKPDDRNIPNDIKQTNDDQETESTSNSSNVTNIIEENQDNFVEHERQTVAEQQSKNIKDTLLTDCPESNSTKNETEKAVVIQDINKISNKNDDDANDKLSVNLDTNILNHESDNNADKFNGINKILDLENDHIQQDAELKPDHTNKSIIEEINSNNDSGTDSSIQKIENVQLDSNSDTQETESGTRTNKMMDDCSKENSAQFFESNAGSDLSLTEEDINATNLTVKSMVNIPETLVAEGNDVKSKNQHIENETSTEKSVNIAKNTESLDISSTKAIANLTVKSIDDVTKTLESGANNDIPKTKKEDLINTLEKVPETITAEPDKANVNVNEDTDNFQKTKGKIVDIHKTVEQMNIDVSTLDDSKTKDDDFDETYNDGTALLTNIQNEKNDTNISNETTDNNNSINSINESKNGTNGGIKPTDNIPNDIKEIKNEVHDQVQKNIGIINSKVESITPDIIPFSDTVKEMPTDHGLDDISKELIDDTIRIETINHSKDTIVGNICHSDLNNAIGNTNTNLSNENNNFQLIEEAGVIKDISENKPEAKVVQIVLPQQNYASDDLRHGTENAVPTISEPSEVAVPIVDIPLDVAENMLEVMDTHSAETPSTGKCSSLEDNDTTIGDSNDSILEFDTSKTDDSIRGVGTPTTMDLETAAVTIQKVFRNFLFKSQRSTFDDGDIEENNLANDYHHLGDDKVDVDLKPNLQIERRPLGLSRMDTVLQTVNEEKSLSLSTDDSSTLSSAATTIQAHVRGFLVRNRLNSNKTSSASLVNSDGMSTHSLEAESDQQKNKTILNIHIVPEGEHFMTRDESVLTSTELSLDSPPSSVNLHPLGYDKSERRKQLKREDAIQSISPPSNNSGKLSEDVESVKDVMIALPIDQQEETAVNEQIHDIETESRDTTPTKSITGETVIERTIVKDEPKNLQNIVNRKESLTKMSSDEGDVVTPNDGKNSSIDSDNTSQLLHSGEFHDMVLPTKVSRTDTSVVREFKNVLVYFLIWN